MGESIIPSTRKLKQEAILSDMAHIREELVKLAKMKAEVKEKEKALKEHMKIVAEMMADLDLSELDISDDVRMTLVKAYSYKRMKGIKTLEKEHPELLNAYPDIVTEVNVKPYTKLELIK